MRWWIGPLHARLTVPCAIAGGGLMVLVDALARSAMAPSEIPAGLLTARMTADALRLDGLRVQASGRTLLDGIDLAIPERGLFGIVGPNGSGKTTLLRAALGLVRPREGRIALFGRALDRWKPAELARHIGYVAQHGESHWDLTVREMLQLQRPGRPPDPALVARFELDALIDR
eukprot:gene3813-4505_t